jgi:S-adenosylmethionine synthetase
MAHHKKSEELCTLETMAQGHFAFTSESVGEGHPDKLCDQVCDAIIDAIMEVDPKASAIIEACAKGQHVIK